MGMELENRMVSAEWLKDKFYEICDECKCSVVFIDRIIDEIDDAPDVELIQCKDCKHWVPGDSFGGDSLDDMQRIGRCPIMRFGRREKDFCCDGERKDND